MQEWIKLGYAAFAFLPAAAVSLGGRRVPGRERPRLVSTLARISSVVNRSPDVSSVLAVSLEETLLLLGMDAGVIRIIAGPGSVRPLTIHRGLPPALAAVLDKPDSGRRPHFESASDILGESLRQSGFEYFALFPIRSGNRTLGTLGLASRKTRPTGDVQEEFLAALTELLGVAVSNASLDEQARKLSEDLVALQEVNKIISQSLDHEGVIGRIVVEGKRLVKTSQCHLLLVDDRLHSLVGAASTLAEGFDIGRVQIGLTDDSSIVRALNEKQTIAIDGPVQSDTADVRMCHLLHCQSAIFAPLITKEQAIGVLVCAEEVTGRRFDRDDVSRAETLAHQTAIAIENARLFGVVSRSQREWETTFDALPECVSVHDTSGRVIRANMALAQRLRMSPQAVVGKYCEEIYGNGLATKATCRHARPVDAEGYLVEEIEPPRAGGVFQLSVSRWYDKNNRLAGTIHIAKDISNERFLQQQLIQSEKLSAIGELISGVAHELNNPLTGVMGYAQLLQMRKDLDERARESLQKINGLALRCQKIVQNLLSFARKQKPERKLCSINDILGRTLDLRAYELRVNNIDVVNDLDRDLPQTIADSHQLQQVFLNVLTNAEQVLLEHRGRGTITIRTRAVPSERIIVAEISDNGPGIPEAHLTKIFDPFFTTKEVGKGTGLGLSLSYGIIKEHGGNIYACSKPGEGATFVVEIPIIERIASEQHLPLQLVPTPIHFDSAVRNKKILIVDDERYILDFFVEVFRTFPVKLDTASDGRVAIELIESGNYDVIVSDFRMPQIGGRELFDWIRMRRPALASRIIFITGDTVSAETRSFFEATNARYLAKPFKIEEVKDVILQTLQDFA